MICSVVIPVYNERDNVRAIHKVLGEAVAEEPYLRMLDGEGYRENVLPIDHLTPNPS